MGFVKYHGEKNEYYDDVVEYAKSNETLQKETFSEEEKRIAAAEYFGVPELGKLNNEDILKRLIYRFKLVCEMHDKIVSTSKNNSFIDDYAFNDLWRFSISSLVEKSTLPKQTRIKLCEILFNTCFRLPVFMPPEDYYKYYDTVPVFKKYINDCFNPIFLDRGYYWQWIGSLKGVNKEDVQKFVSGYIAFDKTLAFYLNQRFPNAEIKDSILKVFNIKKDHPDYSYSMIAREAGCSKSAVAKYLKGEPPKFEKVSAKAVLNRKELQTFHPDLQMWLSGAGSNARVHTGITKKQGGNISVADLKKQRDYLKEHGTNVDKIVEHIDAVIEHAEMNHEQSVEI